MKNLYLLPTDKPSRLQRCASSEWFDILKESLIDDRWMRQHIYITSDGEIKEGDWCIDIENNIIFKVKEQGHSGLLRSSTDSFVEDFCKKIILTTDQDLIKDGVQSIGDEFLRWFVNNPSCEFVEIEEVYPLTCCIQKEGKTKMNNGCMERNRCMNYKIIIPQEEPKQKTLEEAAENYISKKILMYMLFLN